MIYLCILFGVFLIIGISISNHKKWATSWSEYDLSIFELYSNIKKANAGDAKAAYALGMYYSFIKNNDKEALLWFERSAANNFPPALYELITYYSISSYLQIQDRLLSVYRVWQTSVHLSDLL